MLFFKVIFYLEQLRKMKSLFTFDYLESVMSTGKFKESSARKLFSVQLLIPPECNHNLSGIHVIKLLDKYNILYVERDRQIRYKGGTVKFVTEDGPSNSLQTRDRKIRYRGGTVKFVTEEGQSNSLEMSYRQICYREGTVKFVRNEL